MAGSARCSAALGIKVAFTPLGILVALTFIGLPFVVRTVQPVLEDLDPELEEAAATLGASMADLPAGRSCPSLLPALLTGFALAFARAIGEYGSVIFIAGNMPMVSEITPLMIITKLEQYDYAGATAIAVVMLVAVFPAAARDQPLQAWTRRRAGVLAVSVDVMTAATARPRPATPAREPAWVRGLLIGDRIAVPHAVPLRAAGGRVRRGAEKGWRRLRRGAHRAGRVGGDPAHAAGRGDRRAAQSRVRRGGGVGRSPSSSFPARAC